ncbi:hypothetical protein CJG84_24445 [Salmonella enterica]|nr:hypothetical protein [Salmonella enterica]
MKKAIFRLSLLLVTSGFIYATIIFLFPPEITDRDGNIIGEMPKEFALSVLMVLSGISGLVITYIINFFSKKK